MFDKIKLIEKDTVLPEIRPLSWDVVLHGKPYYVAFIGDYVHSIGGKNGVNNMWMWPRDEKPCYENLIEYNLDEPVCWGIRHEPRNYTQTKWGECEARTGNVVIITRNGEDFCDVPGGLYYGIDKARMMITEFKEHALNFYEIDYDKKVIGRKVWWRSEPAVVTDYVHGQACVILKPDGKKFFSVPKEYADNDWYEDQETIKADILDNHIWWFRD